MSTPAQSFSHHARFYPMWHFVAFPILAINVVVATVAAVRAPGLVAAWDVAVAVALVLTLLTARFMSLKNQDRIIRGEERQRIRVLGEGTLVGDVMDFTIDELIGLRFASDEELIDLANRVSAGDLVDRTEIKRAIRVWRPDHHRV